MSGSHSQHSNGIHFLKVIHERTLQRRKLRVPTSFVKRYWEGISNPVTVKLPNKTEWKINWKKIDGDIWFCNNGWKEFTKHVSLRKLQYLVFQFEGNSCFNVNVLGKNGLEIKYKETIQEEFQEVHHESSDSYSSSVKVLDYSPQSSSSNPLLFKDQGEQYNLNQNSDSYSVDILDEPPSRNKKTRPKPPISSPQPLKKFRMEKKGYVEEMDDPIGFYSLSVLPLEELLDRESRTDSVVYTSCGRDGCQSVGWIDDESDDDDDDDEDHLSEGSSTEAQTSIEARRCKICGTLHALMSCSQSVAYSESRRKLGLKPFG